MNAASSHRETTYTISNGSETTTVGLEDLTVEGDRLSEGGKKITILERHADGMERWLVAPEGYEAPKPDTLPAPPPTEETDVGLFVLPPVDRLPTIVDSLESSFEPFSATLNASDLVISRNAAPAPVERSTFKAQIVDNGAARGIAADHQALTEEGFALPNAYFAVGTVLAESGVRTFQAKKDAWEAAPRIADACEQIEARVQAEDRKDYKVKVGDLRMNDDGSIGRTDRWDIPHFSLTSNVFTSFSSRIGMPSASEYLRKCDPSLRAYNVNAWLERNATKDIVLRTMNGDAGRRVYAVVSDSYAECNADKIAEAMKLAMQSFPEARGHITYDADRARIGIEAEFMSPIQPEHAAVGEIWRATVRAFGDDTGGGSIKGGGGVSMALCLNFTYADVDGYAFQLRHLGRMQEIVRKLREGINKSLKQVERLVTRWGYACKEDVLENSRALATAEGETALPMPVSLALPWLFAGMVDRELIPVHGKKQDFVKRLVSAYEADNSSAVRVIGSQGISRASLTNAVTRVAHEELTDPWEVNELQRAGSSVLWSDRAIPMVNPDRL